MKITRRDFLKRSGLAATAATLAHVGQEGRVVEAAQTEPLKIQYAQESTTICAYCSGGCGVIAHVRDGELVNMEGDPDHPVNRGALCSKGMALLNLRYVVDRHGNLQTNPNRLQKVKYRAPGSSEWEEKSWDWAIDQIAQRIKDTRDGTFETTDENGVTVNRTTAIGHLGSAAIDNEENYLMVKLQRALGLVYVDHHARL